MSEAISTISFLVRGDGRIFISPFCHEILIQKNGIDDSGQRARETFVRVSYNGKNITYLGHNLPNNNFPDWYENHRYEFEERIKKAFEKTRLIMKEYAVQRQLIEEKYTIEWNYLQNIYRLTYKSREDYLKRCKTNYEFRRDNANRLDEYYTTKMQVAIDT